VGRRDDAGRADPGHIREARALVIATPETVQVRKMVEAARRLNADVEVVVRSHNPEEAERLRSDGTGTVFVGETELATAMTRHVLGLGRREGGAARGVIDAPAAPRPAASAMPLHARPALSLRY
jgi:CPA2 family monovalent cation:H+ antiporter-2